MDTSIGVGNPQKGCNQERIQQNQERIQPDEECGQTLEVSRKEYRSDLQNDFAELPEAQDLKMPQFWEQDSRLIKIQLEFMRLDFLNPSHAPLLSTR